MQFYCYKKALNVFRDKLLQPRIRLAPKPARLRHAGLLKKETTIASASILPQRVLKGTGANKSFVLFVINSFASFFLSYILYLVRLSLGKPCRSCIRIYFNALSRKFMNDGEVCAESTTPQCVVPRASQRMHNKFRTVMQLAPRVMKRLCTMRSYQLCNVVCSMHCKAVL